MKNMFASSLPSYSSAMAEVAHFDFAQKLQFMSGVLSTSPKQFPRRDP